MSSFDNARAFLESGAEGDSFLALPPYSGYHKVPEDLPNFRPLFVLSEDEDRSDLSLAKPDASSSLYFFNYWSIALLVPFLCFLDRFARTDIKYIVWLLDHSLIAFDTFFKYHERVPTSRILFRFLGALANLMARVPSELLNAAITPLSTHTTRGQEWERALGPYKSKLIRNRFFPVTFRLPRVAYIPTPAFFDNTFTFRPEDIEFFCLIHSGSPVEALLPFLKQREFVVEMVKERSQELVGLLDAAYTQLEAFANAFRKRPTTSFLAARFNNVVYVLVFSLEQIGIYGSSSRAFDELASKLVVGVFKDLPTHFRLLSPDEDYDERYDRPFSTPHSERLAFEKQKQEEEEARIAAFQAQMAKEKEEEEARIAAEKAQAAKEKKERLAAKKAKAKAAEEEARKAAEAVKPPSPIRVDSPAPEGSRGAGAFEPDKSPEKEKARERPSKDKKTSESSGPPLKRRAVPASPPWRPIPFRMEPTGGIAPASIRARRAKVKPAEYTFPDTGTRRTRGPTSPSKRKGFPSGRQIISARQNASSVEVEDPEVPVVETNVDDEPSSIGKKRMRRDRQVEFPTQTRAGRGSAPGEKPFTPEEGVPPVNVPGLIDALPAARNSSLRYDGSLDDYGCTNCVGADRDCTSQGVMKRCVQCEERSLQSCSKNLTVKEHTTRLHNSYRYGRLNNYTLNNAITNVLNDRDALELIHVQSSEASLRLMESSYHLGMLVRQHLASFGVENLVDMHDVPEDLHDLYSSLLKLESSEASVPYANHPQIVERAERRYGFPHGEEDTQWNIRAAMLEYQHRLDGGGEDEAPPSDSAAPAAAGPSHFPGSLDDEANADKA
ncbi:hypothetical protein B0H15DRAFT_805722 [Mycena belliarum]|uniref:Uncharacterized protein n=1 Tax=Mycena belliarum TaxID=1033014 RepID=A0AAD6XJW1_9AGAR|nr:hypothetical protein B0H15DRAFT_805722 [Mycena belliae]